MHHHAPAEPVDCSDCSESPRLPRNVSLATGELVWKQEDLRIAGRGLPFVWVRTYRSRPENRNRYWDHAYNIRAERTAEGIRVWTGTGAADIYRADARGTFSSRGAFAEGRLDAASRLQVRFSSGGVWEFRPLDESDAAKGSIARIADRNGNAVRFSYDAAGQLEVITDTLARDIRIGYDTAGRLTTVTDFSGRRLSYRYGANGELTSVTYPFVTGTPTGNDFPGGATTAYTYAAGQALIGITDRAGTALLDVEYAKAFDHDRVSSLTWGRSGPRVHFTYHRVEEDASVLLAIVNDGNGNVRELRFDKAGACVSSRSYTGRADPAKPTTLTENRPGRPLRELEPAFYETRFSYENVDGLVTRIAFPDGSSAQKQYEIDLRPDAPPIERGNLRSITLTPGPKGGEQPELVRRFDYLAGYGCKCGQAFVTRETDARGVARLTEYDDRGNAVAIIERDGSRRTFSYNASGDLVSRSYAADAAGAVRRDRFEYSARHGQLTRESLDSGAVALTTAYEHDDLGRVLLVRDPMGREHRTAWNAWDLVVRRTLPDSTATRLAVEDTLYDVNRNAVTRVVRDAGREARTERTYDVLRRLRSVARQIEAGRRLVITYEYDGNGNRVTTRRGESQPVRLSFDTLDRPHRRVRGEQGKGLREVTFDYDGAGNLTQVTRGSGVERSVTRATYDGYSRLIKIDLANGTATRYSRDANGNVLRQSVGGPLENALVSEITQTFDAMDRMTHRSISGSASGEATDEDWQFDARSRLIRRVDITGRVSRTRYDGIDRPIEIDDGSGQMATFTYDGNSNVLEETFAAGTLGRRFRTHYVRDPRGRVLEVAGPRGIAHKYTYDVDDRPGVIVIAGRQQLGLNYDGMGRPTRIDYVEPGGPDRIRTSQTWSDSSQLVSRTDPNGNTTRYVYDAADNAAGTLSADGTEETALFDSRGNRVRSTDPNGTTVNYSYDALDRLVRREITPGSGVANDTTTETYEYDELGRLIRAKNDQHTVEWSYDALSRVVAEVQDGRQVRTTYRRGTRAAVSYPSGYRLEFDYDGADLRRIRDARGAAIEFDASGATRYARTRGPVTSTVGWNEAGLPERLATAAGTTILDERHYRWDETANLTGVDVRDRRGERTISYKMDFLGRLRASSRSDGPATEYELDGAGNRTAVRVDGSEGRYSLDAADRAMNRYTATPADRRTYDANGNLLTITDAQGRRRSLRYDFLNRLVEYRDDASQSVARYSYDCLGRRLVKSVTRGQDRRQTRYCFDADDVIEVQDDTPGAARSLVRHGRAVYGMVTSPPAVDRWFITDVLGSLVGEFDETGAVTRAYDYGDYGRPTGGEEAGAGPSPVLFAGYLYDAESGFYYVRRRYLEPATGRFITRDPSGIWEDGRNRGNAYGYGGNNPVVYIDPTGQSTMTPYNCNGPWPGPRTITVEYEDCSKSRRQGNVNAVCRAFRASGQSQERLWNLWVNDFTGVAMPGAGTTRSQVQFWFAGPDNATNLNSKAIIGQTLTDVFVATKSDDFDIDCEGGSGTCATANAYVAWGGEDVNLCNNYFNSGFSDSKKASIIIHELTHAYNDTDDYFYYQTDGSNQPFNALIETVILRENADCYEQFTLDFFLP